MAEERVHLVVSMVAHADKVDEFIRRFTHEVIAPTLKEAGCLRYQLLQDREDPAKFALIEEWTSAEALAAHGQAEHLRASRAWLPSLRIGAELRRFRETSAG